MSVRKLATVAVAALALACPAAGAKASFTAKDRANALALMRLTNTGSPGAYERCRIRRSVGYPSGTRTVIEFLECVGYGKPALAHRYHRDVFRWQHTGAGLILTMRRDGRETVVVARAAGLSRTSFRIVQVICGEGVKPCQP
jgi:hypothetical protein